MPVIDFPKRPEIDVLEFEAGAEFLKLVDELRGARARDEFLIDCIRRGLSVALKEARPDLNPGGKRRG